MPPALPLGPHRVVVLRSDASRFPPAGRPRRRSQQLEDIRRRAATQVLPGLLPRHVPQRDVRVEVVDQQTQDVLAVVDGGDVERRVAARRLGVDVEHQTGLLDSVPETTARGGDLLLRFLKK